MTPLEQKILRPDETRLDPSTKLDPAAAETVTGRAPAESTRTHTLTLVQSSVPDTSQEFRRLEILKAALVNDAEFSRRFRITDHLGGGGLGDVFRALELDEDGVVVRSVAIKVPKPTSSGGITARFRQEVRHSKQVAEDSDNIVPAYSSGEVQITLGTQLPIKLPYLVMQLVEGTDLSKVFKELHDKKDIPLKQTLARLIAGPINRTCLGVADSHRRGIIHCDLKPENIFVESEKTGEGHSSASTILDQVSSGVHNRIKIGDWGLAQPISAKASGGISGTQGYMPPEQARGQALDARADIFALGAVLYKMLVNRSAYPSGNTVEELVSNLSPENFRPTPPHKLNPRIDVALSAIVMKALRHDPEARYQTVEELRSDLIDWARGKPVEVTKDYCNSDFAYLRYRIRTFGSYHQKQIWQGIGAVVGAVLVTGGALKIREEFREAVGGLQRLGKEAPIVYDPTSGHQKDDLAYKQTDELFVYGNKTANPAEEPVTKQAQELLVIANEVSNSIFLDNEEQRESLRFARNLNLGLGIKFLPRFKIVNDQQHQEALTALAYLAASDECSRRLGEQPSYASLKFQARAHRLLGDSANQEKFEALAEQTIPDPQGLYLESFDYRSSNNTDPRAIALLDRALSIDPDHLPSRIARGMMYVHEGEFERGIELFREGARSPNVINSLGAAYLYKANHIVGENPEKAKEYYQLAINRFRDSRAVESSANFDAPFFEGLTLNTLGLLKKEQGRFDESQELFRQANDAFSLALEPSRKFALPSQMSFIYQERAKALLLLGRHSEALQDAQDLAELAVQQNDYDFFWSAGDRLLQAIEGLSKEDPSFAHSAQYRDIRARGLSFRAIGEVTPPPDYKDAEATLQSLIALNDAPTLNRTMDEMDHVLTQSSDPDAMAWRTKVFLPLRTKVSLGASLSDRK